MQISMKPIGVVRTQAKELPRHCRMSDVKGVLQIDKRYLSGLVDIQPGERIVVLFCFHQSPPFTREMLRLVPPHRNQPLGVFSTCSPRRPNPIGMSVLKVLSIDRNTIQVKGLDMIDGTPVLDIKPFRVFEK